MRRRLLMRASIQKQVDVQSIYDSMVLWYDIKRQNATNENMATRPILRDLSNNGHDATCYNFAWSKMSSIGGYGTYDLSKAHASDYDDFNSTVTIESNTKIKIISDALPPLEGSNYYYNLAYLRYIASNESSPKWIFKVTGLKQDQRLRILMHNNIEITPIVIDGELYQHGNMWMIAVDGIYEIPSTLNTNSYSSYFWICSGNINNREAYDITIELLPQYPNAIISDGVDDYCLVDELPILTDYTIVAKRTDLSVIPDTVLASKRKQGVGTGDVSGAFQLERHFASNWTAFNFGSQNTINKSTDDIIYQTKSNYCGQNLSIGTAQDSDTMTLFKWNELSTVCANIALYSIILFNRTLTTEEIEWVKTNLINNSPLFNVYSFYAANVTTQITYAVNDTLVINTTGEQGTWLVRGDINLLKTSFNVTCDRPMYLAIADMSTDGSTVNKQKRYFNLQVGLNTVPVISDEDFSQYNTLVICRPLEDAAGEYTIKAL